MPPWAVRPITPAEVYTDRIEHLEYLYEAALKTVTRRTLSTVLLGQRRMGKTEIFKRVVNRLFFEQEQYADIHASVVPVYYCFEDRVTDEWRFAEKYVENFLRWYAAFRLRNPDILLEPAVDKTELIKIIRGELVISKGLQGALNLFDALPEKKVIDPEAKALWLPRRVSDWDDSAIVMFLDSLVRGYSGELAFQLYPASGQAGSGRGHGGGCLRRSRNRGVAV
jgi:hypothetical protein